MTPLVSCICPTRNRGEFLPMLASFFLRQDYPNAELIILDDSDSGKRYVSEDSRIMSIKINPPNTIGQKRNLCCDFAKGELICHLDDDDWYARDRISQQVSVMQANPEAQATAYKTMLFARDADQKAWRYTGSAYADGGLNIVGVSLMYRRSWWKQHQFNESLPFGEDHSFAQMLGPRLIVADQERIVARIHPGNTCKRDENGNLANRDHWQPADWDEVSRLGYEQAVVCA